MATTDTTRRADAMPHRPPMKNPSRERMKAEIAQLRSQLETLESNKLLLLKQKRKTRMDYYPAFGSAAFSDSVHPLPPPEQQTEYEKRGAAVQENKRLRRTLASQLQTVKMMIGTLQANAAWLPLDRQPSLSNVLNDDNGYRFSVLSDGADRILTQVDQMIQFESGNNEQPRKFASTLTSRTVESQELLMLEGRETTLIPFDLEHCYKALWKAIKESEWSDYSKAFVYASTSDTVMVRQHCTHIVRGQTVGMTASVVIKRLVEAERSIVVWKGVTSFDGPGDVDGDVYVDESGWSVMQRVSDEDAKESVVKKTCTQWAPRSFSVYGDRAIAIHPETSAFTNIVLAASLNDTGEINETMENLLIDDCMSE